MPNSKAELKAAINNCANNWNNTGKGGGDANAGVDTIGKGGGDANWGVDMIEDPEKGLHVMLHKGWLKDSDAWWETFVRNVRECACFVCRYVSVRVLCAGT